MRSRIFTSVVLSMVSLLVSATGVRAGYHYVRDFEPQGSGPNIVGLANFGTNVYAAVDSATSVENRTIQVFGESGTYLGNIGGAEAPNDVAVSTQGTLYLADGFAGYVNEYSLGGNFIKTFNQFPQQVNLAFKISVAPGFSDGQLWTADGLGNITWFDATGAVVQQFAIPGITQVPGSGPSAYPTSIALGGPRVYVALDDRVNGDRILVFDIVGRLLNEFGSSGSGDGELSLGIYSGLDVDLFGHVYVGDSGNNRVQVFDGFTGQYITQFGVPGSGPGQFDIPGDVAVDVFGKNVWVADVGNGRIQHFQIPEPASVLLVGIGVAGLLFVCRFRGRAN